MGSKSSAGVLTSSSIIVNHTCCRLADIPSEWISTAKANLHIAYGHTSHGSQLVTGMTGLVGFKGTLYSFNESGTGGALDLDDYAFSGASDLGNPNFTAWETATRNHLPTHTDVNVVIWSWCGQVSGASESDINTYLSLMNGLEQDFPSVKFVYMTGHLDGSGSTGNLNLRNEQIRNYCKNNNKILYDFADIESHDPDQLVHYMPLKANDNCDYDSDGNGSRDKNWATAWQGSHTVNVDWFDCSPAHSQALNGNLKAYAAWHLWARLAGWQSPAPPAGESQITVSCNTGTGAVLQVSVDGVSYSSPKTFTWTEGSAHTLSVSSPQSGGTGVQHVFTGWSDAGSQSHSYTVPVSDQTVTAGFKTQYKLNASENPDAGGNMTPAPPGGWYDSGAPVTLDATVAAGYFWSGWTGDATGTDRPKTITMNASKTIAANFTSGTTVAITVGIEPSGKDFSVDDMVYSGNQIFNWAPGSTHALSVESPQHVSGDSKWVFVNWTDGGSQSHTYTVPSSPETVKANFKCMVLLTTAENPDAGGNMTPAPPGGWYDSGSSVTLDATVAAGYTWSGWTGDVTSTTKPKTITMDGPKSVTATFTASTSTVQITIGTQPAGRGFIVDGTAYSSEQVFIWTPGGTHSLTLGTPQSGSTGTRYLFQGWSDLGPQNHTYTVPAVNDAVTANFQTQYELKVVSEHGSPAGGGWYDAGSTAGFAATSPEAGGTGIRYILTGWTGTGSNSYTGTDGSKSIVMNNAVTETAAWKTQYKLFTSENPDAGGDISPAPPGGWYDSGSSAALDATVAAGYTWSGWTGDATGTDKPKVITMNVSKTVAANFTPVPTVAVTVGIDPSGKDFSVDGTSYSGSQVFNWVPGSTHALSAGSPQHLSGGSKWVFVNWTDGGAQSHTYTVPSNAATVTANFKCMVLLTTAENPDAGGNMTPAPPGGWYDSGASVTLDAAVASGYSWTGWTGDVTGMTKPKTLTMGGPKSVTANFTPGTSVSITVTADPGGNSFSVDGTAYSGSQVFIWLSGSTHTLSVESPQHVTDGSKWLFANWTDGGAQSHTYMVPTNASTVKANFKCMHKLTVNSAKGNPQGTGWYDSGASAPFSVTNPVDEGNLRYWFVNWNGDYSGSAPSASVVMGGPKSVTAVWKIQYNLRVVSQYGNPSGEGWYDAGSTAAFFVTTPALQGNTRRIFDQWTGGASGTSPGGSITMNESKTVQAMWHTQHYVGTAVSPSSSGTVNPAPPGIWINEGETVVLAAAPGTGYLWKGWSGDVSGMKNPDTVLIDGPRSATAQFGTTSSYLVTTEPSGLPMRVDGSEYLSPCDFPWAFGTTHTIAVDSAISGGAGIRFLFKGWSDGGEKAHLVTADNTTLSFTAAMDAYVYLTTAANPDTGGSPIPAPPGTWLKKGTVATLYAVPNVLKGFAFTGWGGSRSGLANPDTVVMHSPRLVTANFSVQAYSFTVQIDPAGAGSVLKSPEKAGYSPGEMVQLTAVPAGGYRFDSWSVDATGTANPVVVWIYDNKTVAAHFKTNTDVDERTDATAGPALFSLEQNYPNPFNPETAIRFSLPEAGPVSLTVYNTMGSAVRTLVNGIRSAGTHQAVWDGRSDGGSEVSAGTYLIVLQSVGRMRQMKTVFMK